ncbi:MAG: 50S ribosomal protein L25 [Patescibacteria group bacterium]
MKRENLKVEKRKVLGKKVKQLRKDGILPGNIYGKDFKSISVQVPLKEFEKIYKEVGETGVVDISVDTQTIPVLIHNVDKDYLNNPLHAEFYKVNLSEKVKTMVPLLVTGEPKAVVDRIGLLMEITSEVEVEALPTELPENIEVNVEPLASIGDQIAISDLKVPAGVTILSDPNQIVVKIDELVSKEAEAQAAEEAAASEAASTEAAEVEVTTEGEAPKEGEEKKEPSSAEASKGKEDKKEEEK